MLSYLSQFAHGSSITGDTKEQRQMLGALEKLMVYHFMLQI